MTSKLKLMLVMLPSAANKVCSGVVNESKRVCVKFNYMRVLRDFQSVKNLIVLIFVLDGKVSLISNEFFYYDALNVSIF